jgi:hypothetical protein
MNLQKPRWRELWPLISGIITGFSVMAFGDVASIVAILLGAHQEHLLFKAAFMIGVLAGGLLIYLVIVLPIQASKRHLSSLFDDMCSICDGYERLTARLQQRQRKRRVEGDEWKDFDP